MSKLLIAIALLALMVSVFALATPREVVVGRTTIVEKEATTEPIELANFSVAPKLSIALPTPPHPAIHHLHTPTSTYRWFWAESDGYHQWKNSVKTEDKYLPSHFGLGSSLSSSGHWERR